MERVVVNFIIRVSGEPGGQVLDHTPATEDRSKPVGALDPFRLFPAPVSVPTSRRLQRCLAKRRTFRITKPIDCSQTFAPTGP